MINYIFTWSHHAKYILSLESVKVQIFNTYVNT